MPGPSDSKDIILKINGIPVEKSGVQDKVNSTFERAPTLDSKAEAKFNNDASRGELTFNGKPLTAIPKDKKTELNPFLQNWNQSILSPLFVLNVKKQLIHPTSIFPKSGQLSNDGGHLTLKVTSFILIHRNDNEFLELVTAQSILQQRYRNKTIPQAELNNFLQQPACYKVETTYVYDQDGIVSIDNHLPLKLAYELDPQPIRLAHLNYNKLKTFAAGIPKNNHVSLLELKVKVDHLVILYEKLLEQGAPQDMMQSKINSLDKRFAQAVEITLYKLIEASRLTDCKSTNSFEHSQNLTDKLQDSYLRACLFQTRATTHVQEDIPAPRAKG